MITAHGKCWLWTGATGRGYGVVQHGGKLRPVHRVVYEEMVGAIPDGLQLDHLCRVRNCYNPSHLEPVTAAENTRRARALITHCPRGHAYDEANTYMNPNSNRGGGYARSCRECGRVASRKWKAENR